MQARASASWAAPRVCWRCPRQARHVVPPVFVPRLSISGLAARRAWLPRSGLAPPSARRRVLVVVSAQHKKPHDKRRGDGGKPGGGRPKERESPDGCTQTALAEAATVSAVLAAVASSRGHLTPLNAATAIHRLAKLSRGAPSPAPDSPAAPSSPPGLGPAPGPSAPPLPPHPPKLGFLSDDRFAYVVARVERDLDDMSARQVATALWALGKLQFSPPASFWARAEAYAARELQRFSARDISNVLWCYANLGRAPPAPLANGFVSLAWRLLSKKGRGPESQAESNILWSLAKLSALDPALRPPQRRLEEFEAFSAGGLSQYTGQELALVIWSFATLSHRPSPEWLAAFFAATQSKAADLWPQGISMVLWAAATLALPAPEAWLAQITARAQASLHAFAPQALSNTAWALATLATAGGARTPQFPAALLSKIEILSLTRMPSSAPVELSMLAWSFAEVGHSPSEAWLVQIQDRMERGMRDGTFPFGPLVSMAMSLATMRWLPTGGWLDLYISSAESLRRAGADWGAQRSLDKALVYHLRALALFGAQLPAGQLRFWAEEVRRAAEAAEARGLPPAGSAEAALLGHEAATALWSLVTTGAHIHGVLTPDHVRAILRGQDFRGASVAVLCQLFQSELLLQGESPEPFGCAPAGDAGWDKRDGWAIMGSFFPAARAEPTARGGGAAPRLSGFPPAPDANPRPSTPQTPPDTSLGLPPDVLAEARDAWVASRDLSTNSIFHDQVCASLARLGVRFAREAKIAGGLYSADVALRVAGFDVAMEVDGPTHFLRPEMRPTGPTKMRDRALATRGWPCLSVPYFEWPAEEAEQDAYLSAKLRQAAAVLLRWAARGAAPVSGAGPPRPPARQQPPATGPGGHISLKDSAVRRAVSSTAIAAARAVAARAAAARAASASAAGAGPASREAADTPAARRPATIRPYGKPYGAGGAGRSVLQPWTPLRAALEGLLEKAARDGGDAAEADGGPSASTSAPGPKKPVSPLRRAGRSGLSAAAGPRAAAGRAEQSAGMSSGGGGDGDGDRASTAAGEPAAPGGGSAPPALGEEPGTSGGGARDASKRPRPAVVDMGSVGRGDGGGWRPPKRRGAAPASSSDVAAGFLSTPEVDPGGETGLRSSSANAESGAASTASVGRPRVAAPAAPEAKPDGVVATKRRAAAAAAAGAALNGSGDGGDGAPAPPAAPRRRGGTKPQQAQPEALVRSSANGNGASPEAAAALVGGSDGAALADVVAGRPGGSGGDGKEVDNNAPLKAQRRGVRRKGAAGVAAAAAATRDDEDAGG